MAAIRLQVCQNHLGREAVARCPSCGFFFCRECITEHDDRILCASCLKKLTAPVDRPKRNFAPFTRGLAAFGGLMVAWFFFYLIGRILLATPTQFHEATLWKKAVDEIQEGGDQP